MANNPTDPKLSRTETRALALIASAQHLCSQRTIDTAYGMRQLIAYAEAALAATRLPRYQREGARATVTMGFGSKIPSAYRYTPEATSLHLLRKKTCWQVTAATRGTAREDLRVDLVLTDEQLAAVRAAALAAVTEARRAPHYVSQVLLSATQVRSPQETDECSQADAASGEEVRP